MKKYFILMMVFSSLLAVCGMLMKDIPGLRSNISFVNRSWHKIHLQVRRGPDMDAEKNKLVYDRVLLKGQRLILRTTPADILMYRRDVNPDHADGLHFTEWAYTDCEDADCIIDNL